MRRSLGVALALCAAVTVVQVGYWKNSLTLFSHALAVTTDNPVANNNLGAAYAALGRKAEALQAYREAVRLDSSEALFQNNLGMAWSEAGSYSNAFYHFAV